MEPAKIVQSRGPLIQFIGRVLAETTFETDAANPLRVTLRIWQTEAGNWIGQRIRESVDHDGIRDVDAVIVEGSGHETMAMRLAIMDFFDWSPQARKMVCYDLHWKCTMEVA